MKKSGIENVGELLAVYQEEEILYDLVLNAANL